MDLTGKTLLITGGTGSFGTAFTRAVLERYDVAAIRIFSRDELKQSELERKLHDRRLRFLLGDVRDRDRLRVATRGVDVIVHAAALKQVPACEYNPFEAVQTNIIGAQNVISAAIDNGVPLTMALSTDKAVNPTNLYGATKLSAEKIIAQADVYAPGGPARFASVRYGNVVGSRGSVIPLFKQQALTGELTITDERMTRFWITLEQAVDFVISSMGLVQGGETFVPKIPSMRIVDLASTVAPDAQRRITGIRPGEKLHEVLLTEDEARQSYDLGDRYVIMPSRPTWEVGRPERGGAARGRVPLRVGHQRLVADPARAAGDGGRRAGHRRRRGRRRLGRLAHLDAGAADRDAGLRQRLLGALRAVLGEVEDVRRRHR